MVSRRTQWKVLTRNLSQTKCGLKIKDNRILVSCRKLEDKKCMHDATIPDLSGNPSCMTRIIKYFNDNDTDEAIDEIVIVSPSTTRIYSKNQVAMIKEISQSATRFLKQAATLKRKEFNPKCQYSESCQKNWREFTRRSNAEDYVGSDPIKAYISVLAEKRSWNRRKEKCCKSCIDFLEKLAQILQNTTLISGFLDLKLGYDEKERETVYNHFLRPLVIPRVSQISDAEPTGEFHKLQDYSVGPFTVTILGSSNSCENLYIVSSLIDNDGALSRVVTEVVEHLRKFPKVTPRSVRVLNLHELLQSREEEALRVIGMRFPEIPQGTISSIAKLSCYESSGIASISPFLIDDQVEEFFLDQPGASIYLDHCRWGRCRTNVVPSTSELRRIETRLRAESGFRLDRLNPSLKTELSTSEFMIRASVDISPLAVDGFHLDIRKLERNRFSLPALIRNGTISLEAAAYLYFCLLRRRNIVAIGEPGSGKTTLINALDLLTPSHWRKIALEDVIESIPQRRLGKHQVRLKVEPLEERKRTLSKGMEIVSLLHRTPDLVYLGEIQTASHSRAMFHALSAGLTGLQTCHADSPEQAVIRWVVHHKIPIVCLPQIGIIVHMKKVGVNPEGLQRRKVVRICEVREANENDEKAMDLSSSSIQLVDIFKWNPVDDLLERKIELFETPSLRSIIEYEVINKRTFEEEVDSHKSLLQRLAEGSAVDVGTTRRTLNGSSKRHRTPNDESPP